MGGSWESGNPGQLIVVACKSQSPDSQICYAGADSPAMLKRLPHLRLDAGTINSVLGLTHPWIKNWVTLLEDN